MRLQHLAITLFLVACSGSAGAQAIPFSQRGSVTQRVGVTDIAIDYSRPTARGRQLFPGVVEWNRIWTPGADSATRITLSRDVFVAGKPLPAGSYSIWLIPTEGEAWTVIFNTESRVYHQPYPGEETDVLRFKIEPLDGDDLDTLTIYFPWVRSDGAALRIHWGTTVVQMQIDAPLPS